MTERRHPCLPLGGLEGFSVFTRISRLTKPLIRGWQAGMPALLPEVGTVMAMLLISCARRWSPRYFFSFFQQAESHDIEGG